MATNPLFKQNLVLWIGLTLPVLLVLLFFFAVVLPKSMATPPQYVLLFSTTQYNGQTSPTIYADGFVVRDDTLKVRLGKNDDKTRSYNAQRLFAYEGKTDSIREISLDLTKYAAATPGSEVVPEETQNLKISTSNKSPDGYAFDGFGRHSQGLITELFTGGGRRNPRVTKGLVAFKIPNISDNYYYYGNFQFIGWVLAER